MSLARVVISGLIFIKRNYKYNNVFKIEEIVLLVIPLLYKCNVTKIVKFIIDIKIEIFKYTIYE